MAAPDPIPYELLFTDNLHAYPDDKWESWDIGGGETMYRFGNRKDQINCIIVYEN